MGKKGALKRAKATPISPWLAGWTVVRKTDEKTMRLAFSRLSDSSVQREGNTPYWQIRFYNGPGDIQ